MISCHEQDDLCAQEQDEAFLLPKLIIRGDIFPKRVTSAARLRSRFLGRPSQYVRTRYRGKTKFSRVTSSTCSMFELGCV